jgi:hypothetical protein
MDFNRHRTQKHVSDDDKFNKLLDAGTKDAYARAWHRIERGLRLNRIRIFIDDISEQYTLSDRERAELFDYLLSLLDKKLLNTLKVIQYDQTTERIVSIKGLEIKRNEKGDITWDFNLKKQRGDTTRKKKKDDIPSVSTENNDICVKIDAIDELKDENILEQSALD